MRKHSILLLKSSFAALVLALAPSWSFAFIRTPICSTTIQLVEQQEHWSRFVKISESEFGVLLKNGHVIPYQFPDVSVPRTELYKTQNSYWRFWIAYHLLGFYERRYVDSNMRFYYLSPKEREAYRLRFDNGRIFRAADGRPFDVKRRVEVVMDQHGNWFAGDRNTKHLALALGRSIAFGGLLYAREGYFRYLTRDSGSYRPLPFHLLQGLEDLQRKKVFDPQKHYQNVSFDLTEDSKIWWKR